MKNNHKKFLENAIKQWGNNAFSYDKVVYQNQQSKVTIKCLKHEAISH